MTSISFPELFKATLVMIKLDPNTSENLKPKQISFVFKQVLKAENYCFEDFNKTPSMKTEELKRFSNDSLVVQPFR